jgi:hypothetical protein
MAEASRILTAAGLVSAATGLTVYGIATSFYDVPGGQEMLGIILMVAGMIAAAIGVVMSKQIPEGD